MSAVPLYLLRSILHGRLKSSVPTRRQTEPYLADRRRVPEFSVEGCFCDPGLSPQFGAEGCLMWRGVWCGGVFDVEGCLVWRGA